MDIELPLEALQSRVDTLEQVVQFKAGTSGEPVLRQINSVRGFRYEKPDIRHFSVLKAVGVVSALIAAQLRKGMKMVKVSKFDAADYLKNPVAIAAYLTEAFETNDPVYILTAFDTVARVKGIAEISKATGLSRESLYKTFKETARPEFDTVRKVMGSFGVKLVAEPIEE
jgi:probable addiction module antidote protein